MNGIIRTRVLTTVQWPQKHPVPFPLACECDGPLMLLSLLVGLGGSNQRGRTPPLPSGSVSTLLFLGVGPSAFWAAEKCTSPELAGPLGMAPALCYRLSVCAPCWAWL